MARVTRRHAVVRYPAGQPPAARAADHLVVEEPLEIRVGGEPFSATMRTPGSDIDLVHGLLYAEGIIARAADLATVRYCDGVGPDGLNTYNLVEVALADGVAPPDPGPARPISPRGACGGGPSETVDAVLSRTMRPPGRHPVSSELVVRTPELLTPVQRVHDRTGGSHAAGLVAFDGRLLAAREDVDRHHAADKLIGWAVRDGRLPLDQTIMVVSGRASYRLTRTAVLAGVEVLAAVSAPSSLAVELAERAGVTLAAFVRDGSMNVYTHPGRLIPPG